MQNYKTKFDSTHSYVLSQENTQIYMHISWFTYILKQTTKTLERLLITFDKKFVRHGKRLGDDIVGNVIQLVHQKSVIKRKNRVIVQDAFKETDERTKSNFC